MYLLYEYNHMIWYHTAADAPVTIMYVSYIYILGRPGGSVDVVDMDTPETLLRDA